MHSQIQLSKELGWYVDSQNFCSCVHVCLIWIWERRTKFYHLKSANPRAMGLLGSCLVLTDWCLHIMGDFHLLLHLLTLREDRLYSLGSQNRQDCYSISTFLTYLSCSLVFIAFHEKNERRELCLLPTSFKELVERLEDVKGWIRQLKDFPHSSHISSNVQGARVSILSWCLAPSTCLTLIFLSIIFLVILSLYSLYFMHFF